MGPRVLHGSVAGLRRKNSHGWPLLPTIRPATIAEHFHIRGDLAGMTLDTADYNIAPTFQPVILSEVTRALVVLWVSATMSNAGLCRMHCGHTITEGV
jgi:hypothetical protein